MQSSAYFVTRCKFFCALKMFCGQIVVIVAAGIFFTLFAEYFLHNKARTGIALRKRGRAFCLPFAKPPVPCVYGGFPAMVIAQPATAFGTLREKAAVF
jgi:hypothetical protein